MEEDDALSEDSDGNGSVSDSDSDEEGDDSEDEEEDGKEEQPVPSMKPTPGNAAPGIERPEDPQAPVATAGSGVPGASATPSSQVGGSMIVINPGAPTGVVNNPADLPTATSPEQLSTTEEILSQITSAAGEETASTTLSGPLESNSLAQEEQESTETTSAPDVGTTSEEANSGGDGSVATVGRGQQVGIVFGALGMFTTSLPFTFFDPLLPLQVLRYMPTGY